MRLLDLFCGAGGAAMGYSRAGFDEIVGVDNRPQKNYPFTFVLGDALEYLREHGGEFDFIHASPPCQAYARTKGFNSKHYDGAELPATRELLIASGRPWVIENVVGAPLINPIMLCGTMFGLGVIRHRLFEMSTPVYFGLPQCRHEGRATSASQFNRKRLGVTRTPSINDGKGEYKYVTVVGNGYLADEGRKAMGIDWMSSKAELSQAVPPAYTEWIGRQVVAQMAAPANVQRI